VWKTEFVGIDSDRVDESSNGQSRGVLEEPDGVATVMMVVVVGPSLVLVHGRP